jgi:hypothetical protein
MAKDERGGIDRPGVLEIFGAPAPIGRHGLQRDMGEQHYGGRGGLGLQIVDNPGKLFGAQRAQTADLRFATLDSPDDAKGQGSGDVPHRPLELRYENETYSFIVTP